jgi:hypothetical protein
MRTNFKFPEFDFCSTYLLLRYASKVSIFNYNFKTITEYGQVITNLCFHSRSCILGYTVSVMDNLHASPCINVLFYTILTKICCN